MGNIFGIILYLMIGDWKEKTIEFQVYVQNVLFVYFLTF